MLNNAGDTHAKVNRCSKNRSPTQAKRERQKPQDDKAQYQARSLAFIGGVLRYLPVKGWASGFSRYRSGVVLLPYGSLPAEQLCIRPLSGLLSSKAVNAG